MRKGTLITIGLLGAATSSGTSFAQMRATPTPPIPENIGRGYGSPANAVLSGQPTWVDADRARRERRIAYRIADQLPTRPLNLYWSTARPVPAAAGDIGVGDVVRDESGRYIGRVTALTSQAAIVGFHGDRRMTLALDAFWKTPTSLILPLTRREFSSLATRRQ